MRHGRCAGRAIPTAGLLALAVSLGVTPAEANSDDYLLLSTDGDNFSANLSAPVFQGAGVFVPGSSDGQTIWIRNDSSDSAALSITSLSDSAHFQMTRHLSVYVMSTRLDTGWVSLAGPDGTRMLVTALPLAPGEELRLDLGVRLNAQAPNDTKSQRAEFDLQFMLRGEAGQDGADVIGVGPGLPAARDKGLPADDTFDPLQDGGALADTGLEHLLMPALAGAAIMAGGIVIVMAVRRKGGSTHD